MKRTKMIVRLLGNCFLFSSLTFLPSFSYADIGSVSGLLVDTQPITISGSSFGSKPTALPSVWDTFEDGTVDTNATIGFWSSVNVLGVSSSEVRGSYSAHYNFTGEATAGLRANSSPLSRAWFIQYWVYLDSNFDWGTSTYGGGDQMLSNVKFLRFWNPGSTTENFYTQFWWGLDSNSYSYPENVSGQSTKNYNSSFSKSSVTKGSWHQLQFQFLDSSTASAADAEFKVWFDGSIVEDRSGFVGNTTGLLKRPLFIGFYNAWSAGGDSGGSQAPNDYYIDDVYVDTTFSRVELCAGSTWANKDQCEMQIPTFWSQTSITATVNTGAFTAGQTAYLYVVDANGIANSTGYPVVVGGGGGGGVIVQPSPALRVVN